MILPGNESHTLPVIIYDEIKGSIEMTGRSISSEVEEYFNVFIPYLKDCLEKNPTDLKIKFELEYFNTKTAKILMEFFKIVNEKVIQKGFSTDIKWVIEVGDEDLIETVDDFECLTKLKMKIETKEE